MLPFEDPNSVAYISTATIIIVKIPDNQVMDG